MHLPSPIRPSRAAITHAISSVTIDIVSEDDHRGLTKTWLAGCSEANEVGS
jgi:hypothetical protein